MKKTYCLNQKSSKPWTNLFDADEAMVLQSDDDEQLVLVVQFTAQVRIWGVNFSGPKTDARPTIIKTFINQPNMTFGDVDDVKPTQILKLTADDMDKNTITTLNFVRFQRVNSIVLFIEENAGAEETILSRLSLIGQPTEEMDIKAWAPPKG